MVPVFLYSFYLILYKMDISLRRTLQAGSKGVVLIVGQQHPTLLDATCCVPLRTLLHVVPCCCAKFETGQTSYVQTEGATPNIVGPTMLGVVASVFTQR